MWQLFKANFRKEFIEMIRYYPNTIAQIISLYLMFLAAFLGLKFIGNPASFDDNVQYTIVSMLAWLLAMASFGNPSVTILQEATRGTLEQLHLTPYRTWKIMFSRIVSQLLLTAIMAFILIVIIQITTNQWLNFNPLTTIPIMAVTFLSMVGVGFMMAGIAMVFKQIQNILQILQFILMGVVFFPLTIAPFLEVLPFIKGVNMLRDVMMKDLTLIDFTVMDYLSLCVNAIVYLSIGIFVFIKCELAAKQRGLLSQY